MKNQEQTGLKISVTGALLFAVLGLSFALITNSQAVLLDGSFNLISALMAIFAMRITNLLEVPMSDRLPVGYVALEPFYVLIKGLILFVLTFFVVISNIIIMLRGGNNLKLGTLVIYVGCAVVGNFIVYLIINRKQKQVNSPLLAIESENWLVNALISSGIGISFLLVLLFKDGILKPLIPFIDQIVVILVGVLTIGVPVKAIRNGMRELLLVGPDQFIINNIREYLGNNLDKNVVKAWNTSVLKTGRKFWITVFVDPIDKKINSDFSDNLKKKIEFAVNKEYPVNNIDIIITQAITS